MQFILCLGFCLHNTKDNINECFDPWDLKASSTTQGLELLTGVKVQLLKALLAVKVKANKGISQYIGCPAKYPH